MRVSSTVQRCRRTMVAPADARVQLRVTHSATAFYDAPGSFMKDLSSVDAQRCADPPAPLPSPARRKRAD